MLNNYEASDQISFVSAQTMPLALGVHLVKPRMLHLIQTKEMKEVTKHLANYFNKRNIKFTVYPINSMEKSEIEDILEQILKNCNGKINFNITNGTKLQTIASTEWLFGYPHISTIYIDTQNNKVVCLFCIFYL